MRCSYVTTVLGTFSSLLLCLVYLYTTRVQHYHPLTEAAGLYSRLYQLPGAHQTRALYPHLNKSSLEKYYREIFLDDVSLDHENFTMVMLTYKRESILPKLLLHYCPTPRLAKIVVIWNDVERKIPEEILNLSNSCCVPLLFVRETENKITNRFKPRPEIQTDCVFILDDDLWFTNITDVSFGFSVWQENRHRIVGFDESMRSHSRDSEGTYSYDQPAPGRGVSIMMTATGFLHRAYLEIYFDPSAVLSAGMLEEEDWTMYCDDILMNCVVGRFLEEVTWPQPSLVVVKPRSRLDNIEREAAHAGGHPGLHVMRRDHYNRRSVCLNKVAAIFGHLPLHKTKIIVEEKG